MGMFSGSYIFMTFKPMLLQRLKFLFARTVSIKAEQEDLSESLELQFNKNKINIQVK